MELQDGSERSSGCPFPSMSRDFFPDSNRGVGPPLRFLLRGPHMSTRMPCDGRRPACRCWFCRASHFLSKRTNVSKCYPRAAAPFCNSRAKRYELIKRGWTSRSKPEKGANQSISRTLREPRRLHGMMQSDAAACTSHMP